MRVELTEPESVADPRLWVEHQQVLALVLRPGSVEWGLRRSGMQRVPSSSSESVLARYCAPHTSFRTRGTTLTNFVKKMRNKEKMHGEA
jgi:hypothetical protein